MDKGIDIIQRMTGRKPVGLPFAGGRVQPPHPPDARGVRVRLLLELLRRRLAVSPSIDGRLTDIVEFPFAWVLDDAPFFQYSITLPGRTMQAPSAVFEAWRREFDVLYREDRYFCLAMHPADHRAPLAHHAARGADPVHPRPSASLAGPLRRGGRRGAAGAARGARAPADETRGRRVLVTGAASGIGLAIARLFQREGARRGHPRSRGARLERGAGRRRRGARGVRRRRGASGAGRGRPGPPPHWGTGRRRQQRRHRPDAALRGHDSGGVGAGAGGRPHRSRCWCAMPRCRR